jgi:transcription antitermination factor NusG
MNDFKWFVVYTKPRWEKKVVDQLTKKGIQAYCPANGAAGSWLDRKRTEGIPVFASYVFVRVSEKNVLELRLLNGIVSFVYWLGQPAIVSNEEIETIKNISASYSFIRLEKNLVKMNEEIQLTTETQLYRKGDVVEVRNTGVKVSLPSLGYFLIGENKREDVAELRTPSHSISVSKPSF